MSSQWPHYSFLDDLDFRPSQLALTADAQDLIGAFRQSRPFGGVLAFLVEYEASERAAELLTSGRFRPNDFWHAAIRSTAFLQQVPSSFDPFDASLLLSSAQGISPYAMVTEMAAALGSVAPDRPVEFTAAEAIRLATTFCAAVYGERFDHTIVMSTDAQWSCWFHGVSWDRTWLAIDRERRQASVICVTDEG